MHNKFVLIDDYRILTGSMNFTETGIYGSRQDRLARRPNGNSNNLLDIHSTEILRAYRQEFDLMWGSERAQPRPDLAKFRSNKPRNQEPHQMKLGETKVQVFFSPGYDVIPAITEYVRTEAQESLYFCIFAWSDSALENAIKQKYEGNPFDSQGDRTGFRVKGVFERIFWNQWWSANLNMEGRVAPRVSDNNPNIRWRNQPPVLRDREVRKLHHKYMLIDADTAHNPTVITGSANWSRNANEINDENTLFIHDPLIANQYLQEFYARFVQAGGFVNGASALAHK
jgi:phosphatidylserine/phosphatidylglycerophosphate/cardiolipin synthase-like enzyme